MPPTPGDRNKGAGVVARTPSKGLQFLSGLIANDICRRRHLLAQWVPRIRFVRGSPGPAVQTVLVVLGPDDINDFIQGADSSPDVGRILER